MKKVMIILILAVFSCKSGKIKVITNYKNMFLYYSKGPCLGKCPVYDLWIFTDGTVLYKGVDKVKRKGEVKGKLSLEEIRDLTLLLENNLAEPMPFGRVRDLPVTTLRYDEKEYEFYASKIDGQLEEINSKIENLINQTLSNTK